MSKNEKRKKWRAQAEVQNEQTSHKCKHEEVFIAKRLNMVKYKNFFLIIIDAVVSH